ncbi:hypothetical protein [Granulosicoccus antarcticus]|uniref:Uncharacterized protein n=1 Tax=Granulosicoccus antarcticus IMCC3135 TaxID=1192854 RepID=A0A2Z2P594_9GAMM|nr:hypothetical protein [Granulosicoccus antarcticus]ASJ75004.1 hypothetical protein IMCC3135_24700 [Granulosicoccus antarcticus IMCC3135]
MDTAEQKAILLHDVRAAMVNHGGLQHEVHVSLLELTELLKSITPMDCNQAEINGMKYETSVRLKVQEIFEEDLDQCLPMLQLSSEKLTELLHRLVRSP